MGATKVGKMSARITGWFPFESMGYDETLWHVEERVNSKVQRAYNNQPPQQDAHVQRWQDHKASLVLEWMQMQRYDQDHR